MGKKKSKKPTLDQKKLIGRAGFVPDHWQVWDEDNLSLTIISKRSGQRRVIFK